LSPSWLEAREQEFAEKDNKNPRLSSEAWLQRSIFTDLYEVFLADFPNLLSDWLSTLAEQNICFRGGEPEVCTPELIRKLKSVDNKIARAVYYWLYKHNRRIYH